MQKAADWDFYESLKVTYKIRLHNLLSSIPYFIRLQVSGLVLSKYKIYITKAKKLSWSWGLKNVDAKH